MATAISTCLNSFQQLSQLQLHTIEMRPGSSFRNIMVMLLTMFDDMNSLHHAPLQLTRNSTTFPYVDLYSTFNACVLCQSCLRNALTATLCMHGNSVRQDSPME